MSVNTLRLADVAKLSEAEREQVYVDFANRANSLNGELEELNRRISSFERIYEVSSDKMQEELAAGTRKETAEIGQWLMLIEIKNRVQHQTC